MFGLNGGVWVTTALEGLIGGVWVPTGFLSAWRTGGRGGRFGPARTALCDFFGSLVSWDFLAIGLYGMGQYLGHGFFREGPITGGGRAGLGRGRDVCGRFCMNCPR